MNINIKDRIILNDSREYLVSSKTDYKNTSYYLLTDIKDINKIKIYEETKRKTLLLIEDKTFISKLLPYFFKSTIISIKNSNLL